jgi:hypothetical protein
MPPLPMRRVFSGHSAFHCPDAPFNELLLRPGADISRSVASRLLSRLLCAVAVAVAHTPCSVVPIDPWKSSKDKKNKKSPVFMSCMRALLTQALQAAKGAPPALPLCPCSKTPKRLQKCCKNCKRHALLICLTIRVVRFRFNGFARQSARSASTRAPAHPPKHCSAYKRR